VAIRLRKPCVVCAVKRRRLRAGACDALRCLASQGFGRAEPGEIWLYAPHPRSFDSRVFGPVPLGSVRGVLTPLWTAGQPGLR
jgi:type IV secretory pathway protease TraF